VAFGVHAEAVGDGSKLVALRPDPAHCYGLLRQLRRGKRDRADFQNRQRVEPGVSSAVPTAVAVRGLTS
jgi:hypothetical protein